MSRRRGLVSDSVFSHSLETFNPVRWKTTLLESYPGSHQSFRYANDSCLTPQLHQSEHDTMKDSRFEFADINVRIMTYSEKCSVEFDLPTTQRNQQNRLRSICRTTVEPVRPVPLQLALVEQWP